MEEKRNSIEERFEFLLHINGHIIVQRYFHVLGYNKSVRNSMDLRWLVDECVGTIQEDLHEKTDNYLWGRYNPYVAQKLEDVPTDSIYNKKHVFKFEIKIDKETVIEADFDGSIYPPAVRYQIDIKSIIPDIVYNIRKTLASKKLTYFYGEVEL